MNKIKNISTEAIIKYSVISKLLVLALMAIPIAFAYSNDDRVFDRIIHKDNSLYYTAPFIILEVLLTLFWKRFPALHIVHVCLYAFPGSLIYLDWVMDVFDISPGIGGLLAFIILPFVWGIGFIPMFGYFIARLRIEKEERKAAAMSGQKMDKKRTGKGS